MENVDLEASGPNREQIEHWNGAAGEKWVRLQDLLDAQLRPFGEAVMEASGLGMGESVVDIGCGCGDTTIEIARRVGPDGRVLGVDISSHMLERARQLARDSTLGNISFENADAQTHVFDADGADLLFSRFGVMFFAEPAQAFDNLRKALRADGRMTFVCWRAIDDNPWMQVPTVAAMEHIEIELPTDPRAPGPFAFADESRLKDVLESGGLRDVAVRPYDLAMTLGGGAPVDEVASFMIELGPMGRSIPAASEKVRRKVIEAVRDSLVRFETDDGIVMPAGVWIVTARPGLPASQAHGWS